MIMALLIACVGIFVYVPTLRKASLLKNEFLVMQSRIEKIEALVGHEQSPTEWITLLKDRERQLDIKFPAKEEEALRLISDLARTHRIVIIMMKSQPKADFLDAENKNVDIDGKICRILPVTIELTSSYKDLGRYIEILKESLPAYVTVERLEMRKETAAATNLKITLELNLYLLSAPFKSIEPKPS